VTDSSRESETEGEAERSSVPEVRAAGVPAIDPLVGTTIAGRYRVERLLGSGGMGAVYRAEHVHMRKAVALKVLHREFLGVNEVVARFEREAIAAGRIEHPNVAPATDFGKLEDGSFYLVLEYIDGKSLRALIGEGPLPWERAVAIARQVASALVAAHAAGIVHRDLKPDNVMLVPQADGSERVKVLDFGIARVTLTDAPRDATHLTKVGAVMGTMAYMSPEQALGEDVDERTDLYALGVIVHEMITGKVPFDAPTAAQILAKQITEVPPALPPGVPAKLGILVGELLRKIRVERPPSARAVLQRLDGLDSASKPAPAAARSRPDRRRASYAIGVGAALLGILGVVALSNGEEQAPTPEALDSAAPTTSGSSARPAAASPSDGRDTLGKRRSEPAVADAGPAVSPAGSGAKPSTSPSGTATGSKSSTKKRTQSGDSSKRRTGPGGIYIPPPKDWF
jgi:serine/threonine-protein kinase